MPKTLGEHIRNARLEKGLLQSDVAEIFNINVCSITNWEQNHHQPDIQYYPTIFKFLGYIPIELKTTTLSDKIRTYRFLNGLSQEKLATMLGINESTVFCYENRKQTPSKKILNKLIPILTVKETNRS